MLGYVSCNNIVWGDSSPSKYPYLPSKVYIQVKFDLHDSSGGLYNSEQGSGITGLEFQYELYGLATGELIKGVYHDNPTGYVWPYGFITKFGGSKEKFGPDNEKIARYNAGIDYYVGHENLYVIPKTAGSTSVPAYFVFYFKPSIGYSRKKIVFTIPWDTYNPEIHTDKALFYIKVTDKNWEVTFDGFEEKGVIET